MPRYPEIVPELVHVGLLPSMTDGRSPRIR
jgi:hypothetical protein